MKANNVIESLILEAHSLQTDIGMFGIKPDAAYRNIMGFLESVQRELNFVLLQGLDAQESNAFIRAFWRRVEPYKNEYSKELPDKMPIEFGLAFETAKLALPVSFSMEFDLNDVSVESWSSKEYIRLPIGVKVTHNPTGLTATCDVSRGQHINKMIAMKRLKKMVEEL